MADNSFKVKNSINIAASSGSTSEVGDIRRRASDDELVYNDGAAEQVIINEDNISSYALSDPTTTDEDLLVRRSGAIARLGVGSEGEVLKVVSGQVDWAADISGGSPSASSVVFTPAGNLSATDVQAALEELDSEKEPTLTKGDLTETTSSVLTITGGTGAVIGSGATIEVDQADGSNDGYLSSTDWSTFNNKSDYSDPLTTNGDLLVRDAGTTTRLGIGSESQVLTVSSGAVTWADAAAGGGGSGTGAKNYFANPFFESDTTGVSVYNDGGVYVDGTAGSVSGEVTLSTTTSSSFVLEGTRSLLVNKPSSGDISGFGISFALDTLDLIDRGKDLVFSFASTFGSGANASDWKIHAYDITNSAEIAGIRALNGPDDLTLTSNTSTFRYAIPTQSSTQQLRVSIHNGSDSVSAAYSFSVDEVSFGPQVPVSVPNIGDWEDYTPTTQGLGTPTISHARFKRLGDTAVLQIKLTTGTVTGNEVQIGLPSGLQIQAGASADYVGEAQRDAATSNHFPVLATAGDAFLNIGLRGASANGFTPQTGSALFGSSELISLDAIVPLENASSNLAVGTASTFRMAPILAGGTRVTSTPTRLGEYRTRTKGTSTSAADATPTTPPSSADGMRLHSAYRDAAGGAGEINEWEIFVGTNKQVKIEFYANAGRTGSINTDYVVFNSSGLRIRGVNQKNYDPTTGIVLVAAYTDSITADESVGRAMTAGAQPATNPSNCYFDIIVSENVQAIGFEPKNNSTIRLHTSNGWGSTATQIRRYTTAVQNQGTAITYTDSAADGATFTINESGMYAISVYDNFSSATRYMGISLNSSELTTGIISISTADRLSVGAGDGSNVPANANWVGYLQKGDVVRPHGDGAATSSAARAGFTIAKVG